MLAAMVISVVDFGNKKTTKNTYYRKICVIKTKWSAFASKSFKKNMRNDAWYLQQCGCYMKNFYHYKICFIWWQMTNTFKAYIKSPRKNYNKELNHCLNKSGVLYCMVHSLICRLGFNHLSSSKKIVSILLNLFQTFIWNTQQAIERKLSWLISWMCFD